MDSNMNSKSKKPLIIVGTIVGLCILAVAVAGVGFYLATRLVSKSFGTDPAAAAKSAHAIADYDLPAGYSEKMSMDFLTYHMVWIGPPDQSAGLMIMLAQFQATSNLTPEQMEKQFQRSFEQQTGQQYVNMHVVETRQITIRSTKTQAVISEASVENGPAIRQLITAFPGKSGQALLMIQGVVEEWDPGMIDQFIGSIR